MKIIRLRVVKSLSRKPPAGGDGRRRAAAAAAGTKYSLFILYFAHLPRRGLLFCSVLELRIRTGPDIPHALVARLHPCKRFRSALSATHKKEPARRARHDSYSSPARHRLHSQARSEIHTGRPAACVVRRVAGGSRHSIWSVGRPP